MNQLSDISKQVGDKIKNIRTSNGLTQVKLATLLHVDKAYISKIESGKANITMSTLIGISTALNVHIGEFFKI